MDDDRIHRMQTPVRGYEVDRHGRLSPPDLFLLLLELSGRHATSLGNGYEPMWEKGLAWFLLRVYLRMERLPAVGEPLELQTWARGMRGVFANRDYRALDGNGEVVAVGTSQWGVVDVARRRPIRLPPWVIELYPKRDERAVEHDFGKLPAPDPAGALREERFTVGHRDVDRNQHATSVSYAWWCTESVPTEVLDELAPASMEIHFKKETTYGSRVIARAFPDGSPSGDAPSGERAFVHTVTGAPDGDDGPPGPVLAQCRTSWRAP